MRHIERFDPRDEAGKLIDSEHRARYRWASRAVAGKDVLDVACGVGYGLEILAAAGAAAVTGADLDPAAVATAQERFGEHAAAIVEADIRELPFEDASFDVVTCFETIEHVEQPERALAELRRVLRPEGILIVSSPNPDAYLRGNEFHVREFRPAELSEAIGEHFANLVAFHQDAWLGSAISASGDGAATGEVESREVLRTGGDDEEPSYSIVVASDGELPELGEILATGSSFDVRWWSEQLATSKRETAQLADRELATRQQLEETAKALLDANQELAQIPMLRHRLATLEEQHGELSDAYGEVIASSSWRLTAPLRRARSSSNG